MLDTPDLRSAPSDPSRQALAEDLRIHRPALRLVRDEPEPESEPWWTLPLLCVGLGIIACCFIVPQADANHRLNHERLRLERELESITMQVNVNKGFLQRIAGDPNLAERLAQRQMKLIREGSRVLDVQMPPTGGQFNPFLLTAVAPPEPLPAYQPRTDLLSRFFLNERVRLHLLGSGLLFAACGLVLGGSPVRLARTSPNFA